MSAALLLGRSRRKTLLFDSGHPRNAASSAMHAFLSRDGIAPVAFKRLCVRELRRYDSVVTRRAQVVRAARDGDEFLVQCANGIQTRAKALLLATGVIDHLPKVEGFAQFYGKSIHPCPYCDGWEHRDQRLGVIGRQKADIELALELTIWSAHVTLYTHGPKVSSRQHAKLTARAIKVVAGAIERAEGRGTQLVGLRLADGKLADCDALFYSPTQQQQCGLAQELGCQFSDDGLVRCDAEGRTCVKGLYAAGNAILGPQLAIVAAAEGARAAKAINEDLLERAIRFSA